MREEYIHVWRLDELMGLLEQEAEKALERTKEAHERGGVMSLVRAEHSRGRERGLKQAWAMLKTLKDEPTGKPVCEAAVKAFDRCKEAGCHGHDHKCGR